jgi:two-component system OmpR family response regulator/two-component system response regulator QseB
VSILIVEDELRVRAFLTRGLSEEGFRVRESGDGAQARELLRHERFELVLLDWMLPGLSGLELLQGLRARGDITPVLMLTARDAVAERIAALNAGADDYLVKPFDLQELAARMHALARRAEGRAEPLLRYGDIVLNPATREATQAGTAVRLSAREFALLSALMARPGQVWSVAQLQERLYGWDDEVGSNTVEVYIHALRRKFGAALIRNIRGVGYMVPKQDGADEEHPS